MLQTFLLTWSSSLLLFYSCSCKSLCIYQESITSALAICLRSVPCNKISLSGLLCRKSYLSHFLKNREKSSCFSFSQDLWFFHGTSPSRLHWQSLIQWGVPIGLSSVEYSWKGDCWRVTMRITNYVKSPSASLQSLIYEEGGMHIIWGFHSLSSLMSGTKEQ